MRTIYFFCVGLAACAALAACQTPQTTPPPAPLPIACPPSLTQPIAPPPKRPAELDNYDLVDNPLAGLLSDFAEKLGAHSRAGWARASTAKTFCEERSNG